LNDTHTHTPLQVNVLQLQLLCKQLCVHVFIVLTSVYNKRPPVLSTACDSTVDLYYMNTASLASHSM